MVQWGDLCQAAVKECRQAGQTQLCLASQGCWWYILEYTAHVPLMFFAKWQMFQNTFRPQNMLGIFNIWYQGLLCYDVFLFQNFSTRWLNMKYRKVKIRLALCEVLHSKVKMNFPSSSCFFWRMTLCSIGYFLVFGDPISTPRFHEGRLKWLEA